MKVHIQDDSGDKKYFTIIPNYILNHSTLWDREVYIQMKRITGEDGTCWTSRRTLAKQCGMSERRLDKSLDYLVEHKWIQRIGLKKVQTNGGIQEVNEYRVADLWKLNVEFYQSKGIAQDTLPIAQNTQRGSTDEAKGIAHGADKEEPVLNKNPIAEKSAEGADSLFTEKPVKKNGFNPVGAEVLKAFEEIDPKNKTYYNNKTQRSACDFLLTEYGLEKTLNRIAQVKKYQGVRFFPVILSPWDLKEKGEAFRQALIKENKKQNDE